jgi:hypothetical protein
MVLSSTWKSKDEGHEKMARKTLRDSIKGDQQY